MVPADKRHARSMQQDDHTAKNESSAHCTCKTSEYGGTLFIRTLSISSLGTLMADGRCNGHNLRLRRHKGCTAAICSGKETSRTLARKLPKWCTVCGSESAHRPRILASAQFDGRHITVQAIIGRLRQLSELDELASQPVMKDVLAVSAWQQACSSIVQTPST